MKIAEKTLFKTKKSILNTNYSNDMELLTKISEAKAWKFYNFETSYNNWLKKLKF